ncbi:MAG: copper chaperone Copz family protein [Elusimicrobia bacterium]|nr:copper chaperone Copz family protein [Elusimicrobiota bacterium]
MPDETHEACCKIPTASRTCPECGRPGRRVSALTLDHHVPAPLRSGFGEEAGFCQNPACPVVYFNGSGKTIRKDETVFPVTVKDPGDEVNVCYCFGFKRGDLRRDLKSAGTTDIPERIKQGVQEGRCDCERKNPQGACCLGNVAKAIQEINRSAEKKPWR